MPLKGFLVPPRSILPTSPTRKSTSRSAFFFEDHAERALQAQKIVQYQTTVPANPRSPKEANRHDSSSPSVEEF